MKLTAMSYLSHRHRYLLEEVLCWYLLHPLSMQTCQLKILRKSMYQWMLRVQRYFRKVCGRKHEKQVILVEFFIKLRNLSCLL